MMREMQRPTPVFREMFDEYFRPLFARLTAVIEAFPVGSKIAYDPAKGRLWLISPRCSRWNLTPLEDRWEALESLERVWEGLIARASTDNISLGKHASGLAIVRAGRSANDREFSFWRWGDRARSRPTKIILTGGAAVATAVAGFTVLPPAAILIAAGLVAKAGAMSYLAREGILGARMIDESGDPKRVQKSELVRGGMNPSDDELGWSIHLPRMGSRTVKNRLYGQHQEQVQYWTEYSGTRALSFARKAFPLMNRRYAPDGAIDDAIAAVAAAGGPETYLRHTAAQKPRWVQFRYYPPAMRLAMEMVLFQEEERKALKGELERLENAWAEAEHLAKISDDLLPPRGWADFRARAKNYSEDPGA